MKLAKFVRRTNLESSWGRKGFTLVEIMIVVLIIGILLAIAVPNFIKARETSRTKSCLANLKQIDSAVQQWAMETRAAAGAAVTTANAATYLKGNAMPDCPSGGTYATTTIDANPTCTVGGTHILP